MAYTQEVALAMFTLLHEDEFVYKDFHRVDHLEQGIGQHDLW